jgi:hypothetical protein
VDGSGRTGVSRPVVERRARRVVALAAAAGVVIVAGFSLSSSRNTRRGTTHSAGGPAQSEPATGGALRQGPASTSAARIDPGAAWDQLARGYGREYATSGVIQTTTGNVAAVSYNICCNNPHVTILSFDGSAWIKVTDITLDIGGAVLAPSTRATPITAVHLSGSPTPDFAVIVNYNDGPAAAIISRVSGSWQPLTFSGGPHGGNEIINPTFTLTEVTERSNTCTPNCAAGHYATTSYRYSPHTGHMAAVG